jgi:beta-glucosidase
MDYAQGYASGKALYDKKDSVDAAESKRLKDEALSKAADADLIIYIGGMNKNHKQDCENGDREGYDLSFGQNELISELADINPNIVVVTFGGNPYATPWLSKVPALVHCWYLGSEAGTALVNVLNGKVCPSGKLPVTFARQYEDYPYVKYGKEAYPGVDKQVYYKEDVFVGYRGFEKDKKKPLFPFGFGLSYTTFSYDDVPAVKDANGNISVSVTVTNTGSCAGKEVVQVYVSAPSNKEIQKPLKELKAFANTNLLQPRQQQTLQMSITPQDLASWNEAAHQWQTDNGEYIIHVGNNSANILKKLRM